MYRTIIEEMHGKTLENQHLFKKSVPLFTVGIPTRGKISFVSGFSELKRLFEELDPSTIDITTRKFDIFENDKVVDKKEIWTMEFDGEPIFMFRDNKEMNKGHYIIALKRTGLFNS